MSFSRASLDASQTIYPQGSELALEGGTATIDVTGVNVFPPAGEPALEGGTPVLAVVGGGFVLLEPAGSDLGLESDRPTLSGFSPFCNLANEDADGNADGWHDELLGEVDIYQSLLNPSPSTYIETP